MDLFNLFGNCFRPHRSQQFHFDESKAKAYLLFVKFKKLQPDSPGFISALNEVDRMITFLKTEYNHTPDWEKEYNWICKKYFAPMNVNFKTYEFSKN